MATELDQTFCGWPRQELLDQDDSQDAAIAQMLEQGSISFGRYTVDSLAWEKRSVFTHNRCQEELEKLKAPGLVAQKKAYFEAYYKRLRTLKALQANEQTQLIEDYGEDDSRSCKNGELEDENFQHENLRNEATNVSAVFLEAHVAEAAFGMESSGDLSCSCSDRKSVGSRLDCLTGNIEGDANTMNAHLSDDMTREPADSSTATFKEIDTDKNSTDSLQYELHRETSISYDELWRTDIEDGMLKENCSNALQMGHMFKELTVLDSPRRIEEIELLKDLCNDDDARNLKEACVAESSVNGGTRVAVGGADSPFLKVILPVDNHITGEAKVKLNKQNSHSLTRRIKESVSSVRQSKKLDCVTKSEATKVSQLPKYFLKRSIVQGEKKDSSRNVPCGRLSNKNKSTTDRPQKVHSKFMEPGGKERNTTNLKNKSTTDRPQKVHSKFMEPGGKERNTTNLSNAKDNSLPWKSKSASVLSNRPLKGSSSNITTQRQTTIPSGFRETNPQIFYSKSLNVSIYAQKQLGVQSTSVNRHAANSLKASGIEKRKIPKAASILNKHTAVPRARDGLPQRSETRSINLPAVTEQSLTIRAGCGLKGERPKEGKTEARLRLIEGTSKIAAAPLARTRTNLGKQQVSTRTGRLLLDGKKTRQELKPWR